MKVHGLTSEIKDLSDDIEIVKCDINMISDVKRTFKDAGVWGVGTGYVCHRLWGRGFKLSTLILQHSF